MLDIVIDNCLEWYSGDKTVSCTFSQNKYVNKIKKLAADCPEECHIDVENDDGSIVASFPLAWVKIHRPQKRVMTEEQKRRTADRLRKGKERKRNAV